MIMNNKKVRLLVKAGIFAPPKGCSRPCAMLTILRTLGNIIFHLATAWKHSLAFGGFFKHSVGFVNRSEPDFYKTLSIVLLGHASAMLIVFVPKYILQHGSCWGSCGGAICFFPSQNFGLGCATDIDHFDMSEWISLHALSFVGSTCPGWVSTMNSCVLQLSLKSSGQRRCELCPFLPTCTWCCVCGPSQKK